MQASIDYKRFTQQFTTQKFENFEVSFKFSKIRIMNMLQTYRVSYTNLKLQTEFHVSIRIHLCSLFSWMSVNFWGMFMEGSQSLEEAGPNSRARAHWARTAGVMPVEHLRQRNAPRHTDIVARRRPWNRFCLAQQMKRTWRH